MSRFYQMEKFFVQMMAQNRSWLRDTTKDLFILIWPLFECEPLEKFSGVIAKNVRRAIPGHSSVHPHSYKWIKEKINRCWFKKPDFLIFVDYWSGVRTVGDMGIFYPFLEALRSNEARIVGPITNVYSYNLNPISWSRCVIMKHKNRLNSSVKELRGLGDFNRYSGCAYVNGPVSSEVWKIS